MSDLKMQSCVLCKEPAEPNRPWDAVWDRKCAASICKLLEVDQEDLPVLFENINYCKPCHEFVRDVDFTVRVLTSLQEKSQELRTILSQMILPNLDLLCDSGDEDEMEYWSADISGCSENEESSPEAESYTRQKSTGTALNNKYSVTIKKSMRTTGHQDHPGDVTDETSDQMKFENDYVDGSIELNEQQTPLTQILSVPNILTVLDLKEENGASEYNDKDEFENGIVSEAKLNVLEPAERSKAEKETRVQLSLPSEQFSLQQRDSATSSQAAFVSVSKHGSKTTKARSASVHTSASPASSTSQCHSGTKTSMRGFDIVRGPMLHYVKVEALEEGETGRVPYWKCPIPVCSKKFYKVHNIKQHLYTHTVRYKCRKCQQVFKSPPKARVTHKC